uniref:Uncharacterized protein n=1 Tax=Picea sitchensis TaxID=3332 RepID=A0A6B9XSN0_PICSI|nr:hypothetical protein Q903MT_gene4015 [Picea sitchensis]
MLCYRTQHQPWLCKMYLPTICLCHLFLVVVVVVVVVVSVVRVAQLDHGILPTILFRRTFKT